MPPKASKDADFDLEAQKAWLCSQFDGLTDEIRDLKPSEWAESNRYLPSSVSPQPGPYSFDLVPYMKEIVDCFGVDSPVQFVAMMKGAQVTASTAAENIIGYYVAHVKSAPILWLTSTQEMATQRLQTNIHPMFVQSGLMDLIQSNDDQNRKKTGNTEKKIEWLGGGFLIPRGCQSPAKLRQDSFRIVVRDEVDAFPDKVGKDGDPMQLSEARTAAFENSRKIFDLSTPSIEATSKILTRFKLGDQRRYFIRCLRCNAPQTLKWKRVDKETGVISGIAWETTDRGVLVPGSVRYVCKECGHGHTNDDKLRLFDPINGAEWRPDPNATPTSPYHRSYHLPALYSPVGIQSWESQAQQYLACFDVERGKPKDIGRYQVFVNNVQGLPWAQLTGEKLNFRTISKHRQSAYRLGEVPNKFAEAHGGGPIACLTCTVDVNGHDLAVAVIGWSRGRRAYLIDYWRFEGDVENIDEPTTWGRLQQLIDHKVYVADDGRKYRIAATLVDSNYRSDDVCRFVARQTNLVLPIRGVTLHRGQIREFYEFKTKLGTTGFNVCVDIYKDRWSAALKQEWDRQALMPEGHFSAPIDTPDEALEELTVEYRREKLNPTTGQVEGFAWHRPSGSRNELWDVLGYASCALDMMTLQVCTYLRMQTVDYDAFFDLAVNKSLYMAA